MSIFLIIALTVFGLYLSIYLLYCVMIIVGSGKPTPSTDRSISILVAARDEEDSILECLESLAAQAYPADKIEVLVGDDGSEDGTAAIVQTFIETHPNFRYFLIERQLGELKGKQNVLAQLAHEAKGEAFLVSDADVVAPPTWAASLMGALKGKNGMISGPTIVDHPSLFGKVQALDWLLGITINKAHETLGIPLTGVGSNMAVSRESYFSTGGYENIPFSLTEDYKLFKEMVEEGAWKFKHLFHPHSLSISKPVDTFAQLARQRKRWFAGGHEIIWYNQLFMGLNALLMPTLIASIFLLPLKWTLIFYATKILGNFLILFISSLVLRRTQLMWYFPIYELYYQLTLILLPINQLLPGGVVWKGRKY